MVNLDSSASYSQNFDTLATSGTSSSLPTGWSFLEAGSSGNATYTASSGSSNAGDTYSFGAGSFTERALGAITSTSLTPVMCGVSFTNGTGATLLALTVSYTGEQWRAGNSTTPETLRFEYSLDATSLNTGTWQNVSGLNFISPNNSGWASALDGNQSANRTQLSATITGLSIAAGSTFMVRWVDTDAPGADNAMAIDDFSLSATKNAAPVITANGGAASAALSISETTLAVGTLSATDSDLSGGSQSLTYSLSGVDAGKFAITGAGALSFRSRPDFEVPNDSGANRVYDVIVSVSDGVGGVDTQALAISITNVSPEVINGTSAANSFSGGRDKERMFGFAGNDTLSGGAGNDTLTGGAGRDIMTGGTGADDFDFNSIAETGKTSTTRDIIKDFATGSDDIDLSTIDANGSAAGSAAFKFLSVRDAAFTGVKGELRWYRLDSTNNALDKTIIEGDTNGDKAADFHIELTGLKTLTSGDFVL